MRSPSATALWKKVFPLAIFYVLLEELDRAGRERLANSLNITAHKVDASITGGALVMVIWFDDLAQYIVSSQESAIVAIYHGLQAVANQLQFSGEVRMVLGMIVQPQARAA